MSSINNIKTIVKTYAFEKGLSQDELAVFGGKVGPIFQE
jgi:hypothetical protein